MDQGGQGHDHAALMPTLCRQRRPSPAPRAGLQRWQFHVDTGDAQGGETVVADQPAREAPRWSAMAAYVTFQMAEVAVSRQMFAYILMLITRLRAPPAPA
jgi:hypothetical protein